MPKPHRPLRVAVLCSHRAPGLLYLLNQSPDRGAAYEIVGCVTNQLTFAEEVRVERRGIPTRSHPIAEFYAARGSSDYRDMDLRAAYDTETLTIVEPWFPDVLLLDGYLHLVTAPILDRFRHRVLNLHFGDLTLRTRGGAPRYSGVRAVRDALYAGCPETRATVHLVDATADGGPPLLCSWSFPVSPLVEELRRTVAIDALKAYAFAHEQWMKRTASGPLISAALRLVAAGAIELDALSSDVHVPWELERDGVLLAPEVGARLEIVPIPASDELTLDRLQLEVP
jgi:folate-dependent phosphoribosylglycinamide formyltransferase PurN